VRENDRQWLGHLQIGLQLTVIVLAGFAAGYYADRKFGTSPWLMLAGSALAIALGFYFVYRDLQGQDK